MDINKYTISRHGFFSKNYKIFSGDRQIYSVKSGWWLKELIIYDMSDVEKLRIKRPFSMFQKKFNIIINEEVRADITSKMGFKNKLEINSIGGLYFIEGNLWGNEYTIEDEHEPIAKVAKNVISKPRYGIAIKKGNDDLFILGLVMTVELLIRVKNAQKS